MELYDNPKYYEIAFAWRDIIAETDLFEECFKKCSEIQVKDVLEICSGNSPHMEELARRGYHYTGLDLSRAMLDYSAERAGQAGIEAEFIQANMVEFETEAMYDFLSSCWVRFLHPAPPKSTRISNRWRRLCEKGDCTCWTGVFNSNLPGRQREAAAGIWNAMASK